MNVDVLPDFLSATRLIEMMTQNLVFCHERFVHIYIKYPLTYGLRIIYRDYEIRDWHNR